MATVVNQIQFTKEPYIEDVGPRKIKSMKFSVFSGSEISKAAEVQVWSTQLYDQQRLPIANGLLDPRMGPASKNGTCTTCNGNFAGCPGHFGYLKLSLPVFNLGYFSSILNILKCICKSCARILLLDKDRLDYLKKMRNSKMEVLQKESLVKQVIKKCKATCNRCGYVNGIVKKGGSVMSIVHDRSKIADGASEECNSAISHTKESRASLQVVHILNPARALALFKRMQDEDCELLYLYDRPEKLILTHIAVPPIPIRPSVIMDDGKNSNEDDITNRLKSIIEANASLRQDLECTSNTAQRLADWDLLQAEVAQYINSEVRGVPQNLQQARPLRGIIQRLKGKQGRFRGNLSGKRVEYTGRTVISPDPNLKITEVAIPMLMAKILSYPERVSPHNIEKLRQCVRNGPESYPGANFIKYPDDTITLLKFAKKNLAADDLKYGDIVERHLEDGDIVLFNRQPSLHRMSIMSHRARIMQWRTLRFNESVCNPYNADFDGDEMNMHVPQTEEARTEALMLMGVQNNLCTPKNGEILVASTQDFLTSSFLITRKDTFYDRAAFALMCSYMGDAMDFVDLPTPAIIKPIELWTGKQLFAVLIRPHASMRVYLSLTVEEKNYSKSGETMCCNDGFVYFRNSELICGQLGKVTLGNGNKNGLFSVLLREYNSHAAATCMNRLAKLSARWIGNHGFSIGIDDVQPGEILDRQKKESIEEGCEACNKLIRSFEKGNLKSQAGCDAAQTLEAEISGLLNEIRATTGKVGFDQNLSYVSPQIEGKDQGFSDTKLGIEETKLNGAVVENTTKFQLRVKVCMKNLHWRNSPLIMSQCGSKGSPINISQMVACVGQQSVGGRRAPDGFIERSLPHFTRKSKTPDAKGFVANSFYTGLTATEFFFHTMGGREGLVDTAVKTADTGYMSRRLIKSMEDLSIQYDNTVRSASSCVVQFLYGDDGMNPSEMEGKDGTPLNLERLFFKVKTTCPARGHASMSPSEISKHIDRRFSCYDMTTEGGCSDAFKKSLLDFLEKRISELRATRRVLNLDVEYAENKSDFLEKIAANISGITLPQLKVFLKTCISRYHLKRIEAGTAIGAIGAQSIGEPGTQMTLKTFHFAGVASMNVTLGVPRIKEIINGAKNISTPIITAILEKNDSKFVESVKALIQKTVMEEVAESIILQMTPRNASIVVTLDMERIHSLELNISAYSVKQSILHHPRIKLKSQHIEVLDDSQLRIISPEGDRSKLYFELQSLKSMLRKVIVKGIPTVERAVFTNEEGQFKLIVEGTNLQAVMGTPGVDGCKTKCNHIIEVQGTLGIEAARKCIIDEINYTMQSHGMSIDIRHMMLLADVMTSKGEVLGITRFGIQKMKESVLMLASFEKTADHLFNASVNGRDDKIEGVSECIIMGIPMQIGTGILKLRQSYDHHSLPETLADIASNSSIPFQLAP